ncbi:hypothetical protein [Pedobacter sp. GR22-6]|uniref:hypothetical protein n=1 Tax=Pedobacter sp. GR22-6 TaxID=3127957 RepID=UPI00307DAF06
MTNTSKYFIIALLASLAACKKNDQSVKPEATSTAIPGQVTLLYPEHNSVHPNPQALNGKSRVNFRWTPSPGTDYYELKIQSSYNGNIMHTATDQTSLSVDLTINDSYTWFVVSKSAGSAKQTESYTYRFYNSGLNSTYHSPFPAQLQSPADGAQITNEAINLCWEGMDVDEDIKSYDLFFGTDATPLLYQRQLTERNILLNELKSGQTYYWRIKTIDSQGFESLSECYQFTTL